MPRRRIPGRVAVPLVLVAVTGAGVAVAVASVGSSAAAGGAERTVTVARGVVQSTVSGSGNLSPANQRELSFGASGDVEQIDVRAGQHVSAGQVLARIDPSGAEVDLAEARATLQSAEDTLATAQSGGAGGGGADAAGSTTGSSGTSVASATAAVQSAQLSVTKAETALAATKLRAPMAGTVAAVNGAVGDSVSDGSSSSASSTTADTGSTAAVAGGLGDAGSSSDSGSSASSSDAGFITLTQVSRFKMQVALSESDIGKVKVGQPATVTVNAATGGQFAARVQSVGVLASSSSSSGSSAVSYPVTLKLEQTGTKLKAGMSATADIVVATASGETVPNQAVTGSSVTVQRNGKRSTQRVQTGVVGDSSTQILSGLSAGDEVIVRSPSAAAGAGAAGRGGAQQTGAGQTLGRGGGGFAAGGGFPGGGNRVLRGGP